MKRTIFILLGLVFILFHHFAVAQYSQTPIAGNRWGKDWYGNNTQYTFVVTAVGGGSAVCLQSLSDIFQAELREG